MSDTLTMIGRCVRLSRRNVDALLTSLMLPVMLMLLFVYLFGGAINTGTAYVTYVVPGVLLLCAGFGAVHDGGQRQPRHDQRHHRPVPLDGRRRRVHSHRTRRRPASPATSSRPCWSSGWPSRSGSARTPDRWTGSPPWACCCCSSWRSRGCRPRSACWPGRPRRPAASPSSSCFLPYPSSAFVPIDTMPSWIRGLRDATSRSPAVIETMRGLLLDLPVGASPWRAVAWCGGIIVASVALSGVLFRVRTR